MAEKFDDMVDNIQCRSHPFKSNPGGICAFCLQEKLGLLVASSKSNHLFPVAPSSSSSPSFSSDTGTVPPLNTDASRFRLAFLVYKKKKPSPPASVFHSTHNLKRSKSVATRRVFNGDESSSTFAEGEDYNPRKKGFWSFFHLYKKKNKEKNPQEKVISDDLKRDFLEVNETINDNRNEVLPVRSRKIARSRSVGCGSRSFSGDFLERISTGFGDCTLRRVESHREANSKTVLHNNGEGEINERVRCGGIFGGFGMMSSSYWLSNDFGPRVSGQNGRSKSWSWAFASPMRAFRTEKTDINGSTTAPTATDTLENNLHGIPTLLATGV